MINPDAKCLIDESELRLDLEKRIKEAEDSMELAALVQAWCQVPKNYNYDTGIFTDALYRICDRHEHKYTNPVSSERVPIFWRLSGGDTL